jgi:hypothetical protein
MALVHLLQQILIYIIHQLLVLKNFNHYKEIQHFPIIYMNSALGSGDGHSLVEFYDICAVCGNGYWAGQSISSHHHVLTAMMINLLRSKKFSIQIKMNHPREF